MRNDLCMMRRSQDSPFCVPSVAGEFSEDRMARKASSFRVGRVQVYQRGRVWYLCYHENGQRRRLVSATIGRLPGSSPPRPTLSSRSVAGRP